MAALRPMTVNRPVARRPVALVDLEAQQARIRPRIEAAISRVMDHGRYIMGPEIEQLERRLAAASDVSNVVTCSSGTDALLMFLMAMGVGPGDAIICPAFTFTATPEGIALLGASPVFADVREDTFNLDPDGIAAALTAAERAGLRPRGIIAVDLFGQPADYDRIEPIARANGLWVLADAAQSFGATHGGRKVGSLARATVTSFFPAKPLGCYGDGGALFTDDDELADLFKSIRVHGKGTDKYDNVRIGLNARLDTLQAAILLEKLRIFPEEVQCRKTIASRYEKALEGGVAVPRIAEFCTSVWAQYAILVPGGKRDGLARSLKELGISTAIHYPKPLHRQSAYRDFPVPENGLPVAERLPFDILSLPMHPYLSQDDQAFVTSALNEALS